MIRERTTAGLEAARARGRKGGRPRRLSAVDLAAAKVLLRISKPTAEPTSEPARQLWQRDNYLDPEDTGQEREKWRLFCNIEVRKLALDPNRTRHQPSPIGSAGSHNLALMENLPSLAQP